MRDNHRAASTRTRKSVTAVLLLTCAALLSAPAAQAQQRGPLVLAKSSYFFIGGKIDPAVEGSPTVGHMYVEYMIPQRLRHRYPIVIERYALVPDSGGAGRRRGGLGVERVVRARIPMTMNTQVERAHCRPWGLDGGLEATGNQVALRLKGAWKTDFPNAKVLVAALRSGDAFRIRSGGGGGYGTPLERPVVEVREDVKQGYVSLAAAAELYGVVIEPETLAVDRAATERLRAARLASAASSALAAGALSAG